MGSIRRREQGVIIVGQLVRDGLSTVDLSVRFGGILADAGYGMSGPFRQAMKERGLIWAVGLAYKQKVYAGDVAMTFPIAGRERLRKNHVPDVVSHPAQEMLESAK